VPKPNIIFMVADDHRHDAIGTRGNQEVQTPHLDSLMQRGTTFMQTYIMGSASQVVCMPAAPCCRTSLGNAALGTASALAAGRR